MKLKYIIEKVQFFLYIFFLLSRKKLNEIMIIKKNFPYVITSAILNKDLKKIWTNLM